MSNLNLKGIWIPIEILTDDKLSDKEKIDGVLYIVCKLFKVKNNLCTIFLSPTTEIPNRY